MTFNIIKHRKIWYALSGTTIIASIVALFVFGLNFGIDFTGGSLVELQFQTVPSNDDLRATLVAAGHDHNTIQTSADNEDLVRLDSLDEAGHQALLTALKAAYPDVTELKFDSIGPSVGAELRTRAIEGIVITLVLIALYVSWSFRKVSAPVASWKYALITDFTAFHDVIIPVGVFSVLGHFMGWQVDTGFVAAVLTILGYSINDTIVVLDRTRENLTRHVGSDFEDTVEKSVQQTKMRSFNTSFTVILSLAAIFLFGGESTRPFALALLIGVAVGTYSSIFIASPMLVTWERIRKNRA